MKRVICGGQIGEIAAVRAARGCGFETGGWMPRGFRTKDGARTQAEVELYGFDQTMWTDQYPDRTKANIRDADATLIFATAWGSYGIKLTVNECDRQGKPHLDLNFVGQYRVYASPDYVAVWIRSHGVDTLNVACSANKALEDPVETFLSDVFRIMARRV